jgi:hypothetical protein
MEGFSADAAQTGNVALLSLNVTLYELVILDWMLPGRDGLQSRGESNNIVRFRMNDDGASGNGVAVCQRY